MHWSEVDQTDGGGASKHPAMQIKCGSDDMKKLTLSIQAAESSREQVQKKLEKPE